MPRPPRILVAEDDDGGPRMILMSAFWDELSRRRAARVGVVVLEKPFDIDRSRQVVTRLLEEERGASP